MLDKNHNLLVAMKKNQELFLLPKMLNRHGLITGATGTGKTVTLQTIAESISALGVPVFITDIKGDLSGIAAPGQPGINKKIDQRVAELKLKEQGYVYQASPVCFWDVYGHSGHPLRITISDLGPLLLSRLLDLNETQSGVLTIIFRIADDQGLALLDFKDLRKMLEFVNQSRQDLSASYGNLATASLGAIQRALLQLEDQGADRLFGEPSLVLADMMRVIGGKGMVNILMADKLMTSPRIYAALLLWMLSELFEQLPEAGDLDKPKMVFFFDEAHLIFDEAPKVLLEKVEQVVRLIRSKGVGVYFVSQNPMDMPEKVLSQLSNRVQHALRAHTVKEQKAARAAAMSFRPNPAFDTLTVLGELAVGEALISFLDKNGVPVQVERAWVLPPEGQVGPISDSQRQALMAASPVAGIYDKELDRQSAYEILSQRMSQYLPPLENSHNRTSRKSSTGGAASRQPATIGDELGSELGDFFGKAAKQATRTIASEVGRQLARGLLGTIFGGKK